MPTKMSIIRQIPSVGDDMVKLELSCIAGRSVRWYNCFGK